jgi:hypothetical protein
MKTLFGLCLFFASVGSFALDKQERGTLIQKRFVSARRDMRKCLEYEGRQIYPTFKIKLSIKEGKAQDVSFPGSEIKDTERPCLEAVLKKIDFSGIDSALVEQTINFRSQSG